MSRILITGSSEGLGLMAGQLLVNQGHQVVLHARSQSRAADAKRGLPEAEAIVVGDVMEAVSALIAKGRLSGSILLGCGMEEALRARLQQERACAISKCERALTKRRSLCD